MSLTSEHSAYQGITIEDVDQSIFDWFDRIVDVHVEFPTREVRKVPVVFGSGERWSTNTAAKERGYRDKNGVLILPIISLRRTSMVRDRSRSALGTETKRLTFSKRIDGKTSLVQNAISARTLPNQASKEKVVYEVTSIPFPDWFITNYEVVVQTQYIKQMNEVIEKVFNSFSLQNQLVAPLAMSRFESDPDTTEFEDRKLMEGYYFVGIVEGDMSDTGNFEEFTDQERIVRYTFGITVPTYLQLDPQGTRPAIQTQETAFDIRFSDENVCFVDSQTELDTVFRYKRPGR